MQAVYTWVRLAQRIPVRIAIDKVPPNITLAAGMTATVIVTPKPDARRTIWGDLRTRLADLVASR